MGWCRFSSGAVDKRTWKAKLSAALLFIVILAGSVLADPITIDFNKCQASEYQASPIPNAPFTTIQCCPITPAPNQQIVDGLPRPSTPFIRTRKAAQCTDAAYAAKLDKAYQLMRALPDSDPRSLTQQWFLHCAYCGGAFYMTDPNGANSTGIDIHFSWLFYPWHRFFLYFHERILQSLLGDPTFSLSYWNWDNPYTGSSGHFWSRACLKSGHNFPTAYASSSSAAYDSNRSQSALGLGRLKFPDLTFSPTTSAAGQPLANASVDDIIQSNLNVVYQSLVSGGTTAETFVGRPYRAGDLRGNPSANGGGGTLELSAHAGAHFWTGQEPPTGIDMGALAFSARDPVFFAHHSNIDRLFKVWKRIGPKLGQNRQYYSDPDFLNATFLFYDETKTLRRVRVADALTTEGMGYRYQKANDAVWLNYNSSSCSTSNYTSMMSLANSMPAPVKQWDGYYHLQAGVPFVIIVDQPAASSGAEQFLVINDIKMNRRIDAGFDVYLNLLNPGNFTSPTVCAQYSGRFINMKRSRDTGSRNRLLTWSQSITQTLATIRAPASPSKVVVTIVPLSRQSGVASITFSSVTISSSSS